MSYGGRITILPGQPKGKSFRPSFMRRHTNSYTRRKRRTATTKTVRETEAEAVAFVVGKAVGLVTGTASADYISLYHGNASLLAESLEVIQQTASVILAALEPPAQVGAGDREDELTSGHSSLKLVANAQGRRKAQALPSFCLPAAGGHPAGFSLHPLPAVRPPLAGCALAQSCIQRHR